MWSRTRKPIVTIPHIVEALENCRWNTLDYRFDGELYNHDYRENFEELTSLITPDEPKEGHEVIQYHVYDLALPNLTNYERYLILEGMRPHFENSPVHIVETRIVNNKEELMQAYEDFMEQGYEGDIVRNMDGKYVYKRSYDLQKIKIFDDDEFRIVDIKVGTKGSMAGKAVFICERTREDQLLPEGVTFDCKLKGDMGKLKEYADDPSLVIGKIVTVQYQGYTKKNMKPRFPVALRFRVDL
jgi:DNA ligase-1